MHVDAAIKRLVTFLILHLDIALKGKMLAKKRRQIINM